MSCEWTYPVYGCCWNGQEATGPNKQGCPREFFFFTSTLCYKPNVSFYVYPFFLCKYPCERYRDLWTCLCSCSWFSSSLVLLFFLSIFLRNVSPCLLLFLFLSRNSTPLQLFSSGSFPVSNCYFSCCYAPSIYILPLKLLLSNIEYNYRIKWLNISYFACFM